ncbi:hypothetical protein SAMN06264364_11310 [Quadrisphaera granulorum]|uniref:Sap-like sulfolipid-1-addressing protein n=1 Tax=Quadrisphaera granulorum TaxID=317664 RepID=A0A316A707_9ACTN|nr:hypothetical protein [Quadrisphaera granulorum]PWJ53252.1 hypothetical protein BXY45_11310 [Quadrisphaera granulorum]SZE96926.1 hypothetical protein SAMN06264364_11310 [Quadrisphaera granulorum]
MIDGALNGAAGLLLAAAGLGVAGLDPTGALLAVAALAAGARRRAVLLFGGLIVGLSTALGVVLSLTAGASLAGVDWAGALPGGPLTAGLEALAGVLALGWAVARLRRRADPAGEATEDAAAGARRGPGALLAGGAGLVGAAVAFSAGSVLDPSFVGVVVLAGRGEPLAEVVAAHVVWSVVSQAPLVLLLVAVVRGGHDRASALFTRWWARVRPAVRHLVTAALALLGAGLLLDAAWYAATGHFLVLDPSF